MIVGFLDLERSSGKSAIAEDINQKVSEYCAKNSLPAPSKVTDDELRRVRQKRTELFALWDAVIPGDALEIAFQG